MTVQELESLLSYLGASGAGAVLGGVLLYVVVKSFIPGYLAEKGKNLATQEDIGKITRIVEDVRSQYAKQSQELAHQNTILIEQLRSENQIRVHSHSERFRSEFAIYKELWVRLIELRRLVRAVSEEVAKKDSEALNDDLVKEHVQADAALLLCVDQNMPFFDDEVRQALLEYHREGAAVAKKPSPPVDVMFEGHQLKGYTLEGARQLIARNRALRSSILTDAKIDRIRELIRDRVGFSRPSENP